MAGYFVMAAITTLLVMWLLLVYSKELLLWLRSISDSSWDYLSDRLGAAGDWVFGIALSAIAVDNFLPQVENLAKPYIAPLLMVTMLLWICGKYIKP